MTHLNEKVKDLQAKVDKKEAEQKKMDKNADAMRAMSDMGCRALCKIRLQHQTQMDNTSDKNDSVWATITELFDQQVDSGELSPSDRRSHASLRAKFSEHQSKFRFHCSEIQRYQQSGASAEDQEKVPKS